MKDTEKAGKQLDVLIRENDADRINLIFEKLNTEKMQEPEKNVLSVPPQANWLVPSDKQNEKAPKTNGRNATHSPQLISLKEPEEEPEIFALPSGHANPAKPIAFFIYDKEKKKCTLLHPK